MGGLQRTKRTLAAATVSVFAAMSGSSANAQAGGSVTTLADGVLKVCFFFDIPPVAKQIAGDQWSGWDVDFLSRFAESLDLRFEPVALTAFTDIWRQPGNGICDIAGGAITDTEERRAASPDGVWSDNYYGAERSFIVRHGEQAKLTEVGDLAGRTVIVWPNSAGAIDLQRRIDRAGVPNVKIVHAETIMQALESVHSGEAFAFGWDIASTRYQVGQFPGLAVTWVHAMMADNGSETQEQYGFIVRKADTGLVEALNRFIAENSSTYGWPG